MDLDSTNDMNNDININSQCPVQNVPSIDSQFSSQPLYTWSLVKFHICLMVVQFYHSIMGM